MCGMAHLSCRLSTVRDAIEHLHAHIHIRIVKYNRQPYQIKQM